jgi:sec-independent protein translocase protein TatA
MLGFIKNIGGPELIIVLVVVLLVFGAAKLPQLARSLGASAKEFRKGVEDGVDDDEADSEADAKDSSS